LEKVDKCIAMAGREFKLEKKDALLLLSLLRNGRAPYSELGKTCRITRQAAFNRVRKLAEAGVIKKFTVQLNPHKLGLQLKAFILVTAETSREAREEAERVLVHFPQISGIYRLFGRFDLLLEVLVRDIDELRDLIGEIHKLRMVKKTETLIVYRTVKEEPADPVEHYLAGLVSPGRLGGAAGI